MARKHPLSECESCPLQNEQMAPTSGPKDAKIALVSRSPGRYDTTYGKPFSGPAGKVLNHMLERNGHNRDDILLTNLVLCYSDDPPKEAIRACSARLRSEISGANTVIVAGTEAVREFIGPVSIQKARGIEHTKGKSTQKIIATNNPAAVLYDSDSFPNLVEDFKLALDPPPPVVYPEVEIFTSERKCVEFVKSITDYDGQIATDIEGHSPHVECIGFALTPDKAYVIPRRILVDVLPELKIALESSTRWLWHNGVYDCKVLRRNGINARISNDTFPLSYVLDERTSGVHGLSYLSRTQLGWLNYEPESVEHYKETGELPSDPDELHTYNGYDCVATLQLFDLLSPKAVADNVWELYETQHLPRMNAFVDIELRGFCYDHRAAADLNEEIVLPEIRRLKKEMGEIVGLEFFSPASPKQVSAFVYDTCGLSHGLKNTKKRKFDRSFSDPVRVEVLEGRFNCKPRYKDKLLTFAKLHDDWAEVDKQRGTYIEGLIKLVQDGEDKLYCEFNTCGTVTGRASGRRPNFQNITRTERGVVPAIRTLFKPSPGNVLIQADYSQAELRVIAQLSQDSELLSIYRDTDRSLHKETAAAFYGENYTKDEYVKSKNINFGVPYGQSAFAFAQMYNMPQDEAQAYIDNWFRKFPKVGEWIASVHKKILNDNFVVNPFGRKRRFYLITEENYGDVLREGVNQLPQSTASDFTLDSLCKLNREGVPIISTVHDSIIADVPQSESMDVALRMKEVMEAAPATLIGWKNIPFKVDISISDISWGNVEEIEVGVGT